jgi:hypothetical protein
MAPLWVPVTVGSLGASMFPYPGQLHWMVIATAVAAAFGYIGAAMGVPVFRFLRSHGRTGPWAALAAGVVVGELTWALFGLCFGLALGEGPGGFIDFMRDAIGGDILGPFIPAVLGGLVGLTYWVIARPDQASAPHGGQRGGPFGGRLGAAGS